MRRNLRGIAAGLADSFVSRNNDLAGYWAVGQLYAHAQRAHSSAAVLELLRGELTPPGLDMGGVAAHYRPWLAQRVADAGWDATALAAAEVRLDFAAAGEPRGSVRATRGAPFQCTVTLTDERGVVYQAVRWGHVAPHDPRVERRRAPEHWWVAPPPLPLAAPSDGNTD